MDCYKDLSPSQEALFAIGNVRRDRTIVAFGTERVRAEACGNIELTFYESIRTCLGTRRLSTAR
jgi:hypothetical protein